MGVPSESMCARYAAVGLWPTNTSTVASGSAVRSTSSAASGPAEYSPSSYDTTAEQPAPSASDSQVAFARAADDTIACVGTIPCAANHVPASAASRWPRSVNRRS